MEKRLRKIDASEDILRSGGFHRGKLFPGFDVHATLFEGSIEKVAQPEDYLENPEEQKKDLQLHLQELSKIDRHYSRKENLFFHYIEKAGITTPPKVMWGADDEIRGILKKGQTAVVEDNVKAAKNISIRLSKKLSPR